MSLQYNGPIRGKLSDLKDFKADAKSRLKANIIASFAKKKREEKMRYLISKI